MKRDYLSWRGLASPGVSLLFFALAACSATPTPARLAEAERFEHAGDDGAARVAYGDAARGLCARPSRFCAAALEGEAATLARLGKKSEAAEAYERIPPLAPEAAGRALVAAAALRLELGEEQRGYELYWKVVVERPEDSAAEDALRAVVADGRRRNARQLYATLVDLYARLVSTAVGDNLLWALADLAHEELHDDAAALGACDRLAAAHPTSPLVDDALWLGARLARQHKDPEGALRRLRALLAKKERSFFVGSYHSIYLDDAQLESGLILRDDLGRRDEAALAFTRLLDQYPDSTLRDEALMELALTDADRGRRGAACSHLAELARRHPDSKFHLERAPSLAARAGCAAYVKMPPAR